jgi:hypothetical protein
MNQQELFTESLSKTVNTFIQVNEERMNHTHAIESARNNTLLISKEEMSMIHFSKV